MPFDPAKYIQQKKALGGGFDPAKYIQEKSGHAFIPPEPDGTSDLEKKFLSDQKGLEATAADPDAGLLDRAKAGLKAWQMGHDMERPGAAHLVPYASEDQLPGMEQGPNKMTLGDKLMGLAIPQGAAEDGLNAASNAVQSLTRAPTGGIGVDVAPEVAQSFRAAQGPIKNLQAPGSPLLESVDRVVGHPSNTGPEIMQGIRESLKGKELIPEAVKEAIKSSRLLRGAAEGGLASTALGSYEVLKHNPAIAAALGGAGAAVSPLGSGVLENIIANKIMEARRKAKGQ